MSTPVKQIVNESTHTSGGIRKSLLTPVRRIGLSRTRKTPMSIERLLTSPIISGSPVADSICTTPVARRSIKSREKYIEKIENSGESEDTLDEPVARRGNKSREKNIGNEDKLDEPVARRRIKSREKDIEKIENSDKNEYKLDEQIAKNLVEQVEQKNEEDYIKLADKRISSNCAVRLENMDISDEKKKGQKGSKKKKGKQKVVSTKAKRDLKEKGDLKSEKENVADKLEVNILDEVQIYNVNKSNLNIEENSLEHIKIIDVNNRVAEEKNVLPITDESCGNLKQSISKDLIEVQQRNTEDTKASDDKRNIKNKADKSKKNPRRKIAVLDSSSDEENYFANINTKSSPIVNNKKPILVKDSKIEALVKSDGATSPIVVKGNSTTNPNIIVLDEHSLDNKDSQTKPETNLKFSRKRLSLKSSTSTIVLSDSDDDFLVKPKLPRIISSSSNSSQTNSSSLQKTIPAVNVEDVLLDVKELEERLQKKERVLEELKQAKIYKKKHNLSDLKALTDVWKRGCHNAMWDLLEKLKGNEIVTNMSLLLKNLNVPEDLIRYDPDNDCFI